MRLNREILLKLTEETVLDRTRTDRSLVSVYLCGSLLEDDFLLGGTTDIDLVFLHFENVAAEREIVPLTDEVHIDIAHHRQDEYRQPRYLRVHPWLGPTIKEAKILYDPQHFMDFTQAGVRGQFYEPEYVFQRACNQAEHARQIWFKLQTEREIEPSPATVLNYLRSVSHVANAIAGFNGLPLTERRFLLNFTQRAEEFGRPGMHAGLLGLLGAPNIDTENLLEWLPMWQAAFEALPAGDTPARLHPERFNYYMSAFRSILNSMDPKAVLWPILRTWTLAVCILPQMSGENKAWSQAINQLGLGSEGFEERVSALDAFLDLVDETLENWARKNGAWVD